MAVGTVVAEVALAATAGTVVTAHERNDDRRAIPG
jgi:hypothetical protein